MARMTVMVVWMTLALTSVAQAADRPRYETPPGFARCPHATAWHGFFKWASARDMRCTAVRRYMRVYAAHASGPRMPRHVAGYTCRIHYWRDADGDIYASRHTCTRGRLAIRFYGMV
jgi:hypothetical protein